MNEDWKPRNTSNHSACCCLRCRHTAELQASEQKPGSIQAAQEEPQILTNWSDSDILWSCIFMVGFRPQTGNPFQEQLDPRMQIMAILVNDQTCSLKKRFVVLHQVSRKTSGLRRHKTERSSESSRVTSCNWQTFGVWCGERLEQWAISFMSNRFICVFLFDGWMLALPPPRTTKWEAAFNPQSLRTAVGHNDQWGFQAKMPKIPPNPNTLSINLLINKQLGTWPNYLIKLQW